NCASACQTFGPYRRAVVGAQGDQLSGGIRHDHDTAFHRGARIGDDAGTFRNTAEGPQLAAIVSSQRVYMPLSGDDEHLVIDGSGRGPQGHADVLRPKHLAGRRVEGHNRAESCGGVEPAIFDGEPATEATLLALIFRYE